LIDAVVGHPWWLLVLAIAGLVAIGAVALNLFTGIGDRPDAASITSECGVDSDEFLMGLAGTVNAPLQKGGTARLLNNGDEFVPAMLDSIRQARCSINFMTYIWEPGEMSDRFFDALIEKVREGVEVRVMVDGLGGLRARNERIAELEDAGGRWEWFHPPRFGHLTRIHKRNHRRAIIIDGRVGYTGGMSVADKWLGAAETPERWRDCMVEVRGCIATNLQSAFAQLWSHVTGEALIGSAFFPADAEHEPDRQLSGEPISKHICVISSPSNQVHPLRHVFWLSVQAARKRIYITNPYFVPDDVMARILQDRARHGIDVRVLTPNENIDIGLIRWASHAHYRGMLDAGVRMYEYQPTMIHQKLMVVDGRWSIVGSANMDVRSKELNQENVLGILDRGFAEQLEETFFADLEKSKEIDSDAWDRRPRWHRIPERLSLIFEEQF
jgi:cardiolipin synthase